MDQDFFRFAEKGDGRNIKELAAFNTPISTFSPGETLTFDLSQGFNMDSKADGQNLTPSKFTINAYYEFSETAYSDSFIIDTAPYMGANVPKTTQEHLHQIEEHLRKLANSQR